MNDRVCVVGAGLAGCEIAHFLANRGVQVFLFESKTIKPNPSQKLKIFPELVCTNSLKSKDPMSAHGILKEEMKKLGSIIIESAQLNQVPSGDALSVNRDDFSQYIFDKISSMPNVKIIHQEVEDPLLLKAQYDARYVVMATGPLTTDALTQFISTKISEKNLYFYDAIAPIVDSDSLDMEKMYFKNRYSDYDSDDKDYLNIPLDKEQYLKFVNDLVTAQKTPPKEFENWKFFDACQPVDFMAEKGIETLRFSCMKPVGLELENGKRPYAVIQLRKENFQGSAFNLVGFQTRLTYPEQKRVLRTLPGMENAEFLHYGSVHRNTFIHSSQLLSPHFSCLNFPELFFAGQLTGVEGYTESSACGLYVAINIYSLLQNKGTVQIPIETGMGALVNYVLTDLRGTPSNINFGLFPALTIEPSISELGKKIKKISKQQKKEMIASRAKMIFHDFFEQQLKDIIS